MEAETVALAASEAAVREVVAGDPEAALVIALGRAYHQAGVPSDQLEELMHLTAAALSLELQVTALPTSITAALGSANAQRVVLLRLEPGAIDLQRLALLNALYERILHNRIDARSVLRDVERVAALRRTPSVASTIVAYTVLSLGAAVILGAVSTRSPSPERSASRPACSPWAGASCRRSIGSSTFSRPSSRRRS